MGYNPTTLYRHLRWLVEHGFVRMVEYEGARYYHLTGLGARLLRLLREALVYKVTRYLDEKGIEYRVWWGGEGVRMIAPIIYVKGRVDLPVDLEGLVEIRCSNDGDAEG